MRGGVVWGAVASVLTGRWRAAVATAVALGGVGASPAAAATAHGSARATSASHAQVAGSAQSPVIVVLRNQLLGTPATASSIGQRISAEAVHQAPVQAQVVVSGGRVQHVFRTLDAFTLDAFTADVSLAGQARLAADPSVAEVVLDTLITVPPPSVRRQGPAGAATAPGASAGTPASAPTGWTAGVPIRSGHAAAQARGPLDHSCREQRSDRPVGPAAGDRLRRQGCVLQRWARCQQPRVHPPRRLARDR